jgi:hypothetical protein
MAISSYADALEKWEQAKLFRGGKGEHDERKALPYKRSPRDYTIRKNTDGDIIFKMYSTDVITWHQDDTFTVREYASKTTNEFANPHTPSGFWCSFPLVSVDNMRAKKSESRWRSHVAIFDLSAGPVRFHLNKRYGWEPVDMDDLRPFKVVSVDRAAADKALTETNYREFAAVAQAIVALSGRKPQTLRPFRKYHGEVRVMPDKLMEMLAEKKYRDILECYGSSNRAVTELREVIYKQARCFKTETRPWLSRSEYDTIAANRRKYGRYA